MAQTSTTLLELFSLISAYVQLRKIQLAQFWYSDRLCVSLQTFVEMLQIIGMRIKPEMQQKLEQQQVDLISLETAIEGVQYWKDKEESVCAYLSKGSPKKYNKIQNKSSASSSHKYQLGVESANKNFLEEHARKQLEKKVKLSDTLKNVKNQSNYELLMKIAEANDICSKLKNKQTYTIETAEDGKIKILHRQKGKTEKKISQQRFEDQYESLKMSIMNQSQKIEGTLEEDLKKVLVEVMCLSSDMRKQIRLMESKGISH